jgi:hypothetical protein
VFENRELRKIFEPKRGDATGEVRRLHNTYSSPNILRVIQSRTIRMEGHVARMGDKRGIVKI